MTNRCPRRVISIEVKLGRIHPRPVLDTVERGVVASMFGRGDGKLRRQHISYKMYVFIMDKYNVYLVALPSSVT